MIKKFLLLLAVVCIITTLQAQTLKVATYNIRYEKQR